MKKHIVCFGDSNTYGYDGDTGNRFDENERWTCLLSKYLGDDYLVIEEGLGGRTTCFDDPLTEGVAGINYITPCLLSHSPVDLLIIMLGTNDTKERFSVNSDCIGLAMNRLVRKAIDTYKCWNTTPNILIVTPKNIDDEYIDGVFGSTMGKGCALKSRGLRKVFEEVAKANGCHYFDANTVVTNNNKVDYMHIDKQGHEELATALAKIVKELI